MSIQQTIEQGNIMNNSYQRLAYERNQIEKISREYETLDRAVDNGSIILTSNYYSYISLFFTAILLILLFLKFSFTGSQSGGGNNIGYLHNVYKLLPIFLAVFAIFILLRKTNW
jgi:hypothetical protein